MAKAKISSKSLDFGHLLKSSLITVAVAEVIPLLVGALYVWWQVKTLGPINDLHLLMNRASYGWSEISSFMNFGFGAGMIVALGIVIATTALVVDEWFFSHRFDSPKQVALLSLSWGASFLLIDRLLTALGAPTVASISSYVMIIFLVVIMLTPFGVYFGRKVTRRK